MNLRTVCLLLVFCVGSSQVRGQETSVKPGVPESFPKVSLAPDSEPQYAAVAVDAEATKVAYVLFDGNMEEGYKRAYIWVPGDPKFLRPKSAQLSDTATYAPFTFKEKTMDEETAIVWTFGWRKAGGLRTHHDYVTGQTTQTTVADYNLFSFNCDYMHKPRISGPRSSGSSAIDIGIPGWLNTAGSWEGLQAPIAPWKRLYHYMEVKTSQEEKDMGKLHLVGRITHHTGHYGWRPVTVRAMPDGATMTLVVSPYLDPPILSNRLDSAEAFSKGVDMDVPYGWYDIKWDIECPGLKSTQRSDHIYLQPYPVTRPSPY